MNNSSKTRQRVAPAHAQGAAILAVRCWLAEITDRASDHIRSVRAGQSRAKSGQKRICASAIDGLTGCTIPCNIQAHEPGRLDIDVTLTEPMK